MTALWGNKSKLFGWIGLKFIYIGLNNTLHSVYQLFCINAIYQYKSIIFSYITHFGFILEKYDGFPLFIKFTHG
ncbi:MAG: hypothetical protein COY66_01065 [Candidatus Kerfeldbacteria bacterium CG_4_10_14_0_8_um_filter_42_10]|uniref:Uncharacterized protein n=1 Tax=Candidatus Kerfeldbacteria bacterium CG_4_10_14_0_8_um_filter_42_10 TaxID=2014248 RepID=A0A2M7RK73_9BACT|nr:MAG: hypothetical protein COY66_01065 [Candidatus Kerfeldbacteria bacterium CG_4_10_14_0_8_um_filter_42_10]